MRKRLPILLVALVLAAPIQAQDFPAPALKPFISKQGKKSWRPPLPKGATLVGFDASEVVQAIRSKGVYVETEYLRLVSTIPGMKAPPTLYPRVRESLDVLAKTYPKLKAKYPVLNRAQAAHMIAFHLERVMAETWRLFGNTRQTYVDYLKSHKLGPYMRQKGKFEGYLFSSESKYNQFADKFTGRTSMLGQRYTVVNSDSLAFLVSPPSGGARSLNRWVNLTVNNFAHLLLMSEIRNSFRVPMWLDIGFAHWMEQREGFELNTYTHGEGGGKVNFAHGDWRPELRSLVATGKAPSFDTFFTEQTLSEYSGTMRGVCFGLVDYMIREHQDGLRTFIRLLRETDTGVREVFRKAFDMSPSLFFERWQSWAGVHYTPGGLKELPRDPIPKG